MLVIMAWILSNFIKCRKRLFTGVIRILRFYLVLLLFVFFKKFGVKIGVREWYLEKSAILFR